MLDWAAHSTGWEFTLTDLCLLTDPSWRLRLKPDAPPTFFFSYLLTWRCFLQFCLYRSSNASFQLVFHLNYSTCRCIFSFKHLSSYSATLFPLLNSTFNLLHYIEYSFCYFIFSYLNSKSTILLESPAMPGVTLAPKNCHIDHALL